MEKNFELNERNSSEKLLRTKNSIKNERLFTGFIFF